MWKREEKWGAATLDNRWVDVSDNRVSHPLRTSGGFHCRTDKIKLPRVKRASESPVQICIQELGHYKMRSCTQVAFPPETYCEDLWSNSAGPSREAKFCYFTTWRMPYLHGNQWWLKNTGIKPSMSEIGYHRTHHQPAPGHRPRAGAVKWFSFNSFGDFCCLVSSCQLLSSFQMFPAHGSGWIGWFTPEKSFEFADDLPQQRSMVMDGMAMQEIVTPFTTSADFVSPWFNYSLQLRSIHVAQPFSSSSQLMAPAPRWSEDL